MPAFLLSPLVKWSLVTLGGAMVVHWVVKEARRINDELDSRRQVRVRVADRAPANIAPDLLRGRLVPRAHRFAPEGND